MLIYFFMFYVFLEEKVFVWQRSISQMQNYSGMRKRSKDISEN